MENVLKSSAYSTTIQHILLQWCIGCNRHSQVCVLPNGSTGSYFGFEISSYTQGVVVDSDSLLDCDATGQAIDPAPGAWSILQFIPFVQVCPMYNIALQCRMGPETHFISFGATHSVFSTPLYCDVSFLFSCPLQINLNLLPKYSL